MSEIITKINIKDKGETKDLTDVIANPELVGDEQTLNGLYVNGETYKIINGTNYQGGNLILISGDTISVDKSKISIDNDNTLLGNANFNNDGNTHTTVVGYNNTIGNHPFHIGTNSLYNVVLGDKNTIAYNSSYNSLMGYDNIITYSSQSIALGYKNSIGSAEREQDPDGSIIAIGSSNKLGDVSGKSCKNIIGIGNNINNQDNYTFTIDTNASGTYGSTRSSLEGKLDGLYYNNEKINVVNANVQETPSEPLTNLQIGGNTYSISGGGSGTTLYKHKLIVRFLDGCSNEDRFIAMTIINSNQTQITTNEQFKQLFINNGWTFDDEKYILQDCPINEIFYEYVDPEDPSTLHLYGMDENSGLLNYNVTRDCFESAYLMFDQTLIGIYRDIVVEM